MEISNAAILGVIQGVTEFLPISSSGHLVIVRDILHIQVANGLSFDAILQLATTLAIVVYFRKDVWALIISTIRLLFWRPQDDREKRKTLAIIFGTIPAVIVGLFIESYMETVFRNSILVAYMLIVGSCIMYLAEKYGRNHRSISVQTGFVVGLFQTLALIPGMSRSGMSIAGGLLCGLSREEAARFSFLLALPILGGSGIKKLFEIGIGSNAGIGVELLVGSLVSFIVGIAVIHFLLRYLRQHTLRIFIVYRILLALVILFIF